MSTELNVIIIVVALIVIVLVTVTSSRRERNRQIAAARIALRQDAAADLGEGRTSEPEWRERQA